VPLVWLFSLQMYPREQWRSSSRKPLLRNSWCLLAGFAVAAGHNWPVYIGLRGGRGQATTIGVLCALLPQAMLILLAVCAVPFLVTRNTKLAGVILFAPLWLVALLTGASGVLVAYSIGLPCLVGLTHLLTIRHLPDETRRKTSYMR